MPRLLKGPFWSVISAHGWVLRSVINAHEQAQAEPLVLSLTLGSGSDDAGHDITFISI